MIYNHSVYIYEEISRMMEDGSGIVAFFNKKCGISFPYCGIPLHPHLPLYPPKDYRCIIWHIILPAFLYAEARFIQEYIPQGSHEERLTGHLISEFVSSLRIVKDSFQKVTYELCNKYIPLEFYYKDVSTKGQEKHTGADFAIILHINLPNETERVRCAMFQVKKLPDSNNPKIMKDQQLALINGNKEGGFYCFYDMKTEKTMSPIACMAKEIPIDENYPKNSKTCKLDYILSCKSFPLSYYLVHMMVVKDKYKLSKEFLQLTEAVKFVLRKVPGVKPPRRVLMISIGGLKESKQEIKDFPEILKTKQDKQD